MPDTAPTPDNDAADGEVKRKFREALERKQAKAKAGTSHEDAGTKPQNAHGMPAGKREFRRKTG